MDFLYLSFALYCLLSMAACCCIIWPPTIGKGTISIAFVCLSVRLSDCSSHTQRIIREPKGLACPNLDGRFPTFDATRTPVSRSNGQRSELEAGGGIQCRPNPAATLLIIVICW